MRLGGGGTPAGRGKEPGAQEGQRTLRPLRPRLSPALWPDPGAAERSLPSLQRARFAFYRCAALLRWRLPHTLFCALAWERGLSARHFLWSRLVRGAGLGAGAGPGRD